MTLCVSFCWSDLYALSWWMKQLFFFLFTVAEKGRVILSLSKRFWSVKFFEWRLLLTWWKLNKVAKLKSIIFWWKSIKITSNEICFCRRLFCDDLMLLMLMMHLPNSGTALKFQRIVFISLLILPKSLCIWQYYFYQFALNFSFRFTPKCISIEKQID